MKLSDIESSHELAICLSALCRSYLCFQAGSDPMADIVKLAESKDMLSKIAAISLGQGQVKTDLSIELAVIILDLCYVYMFRFLILLNKISILLGNV